MVDKTKIQTELDLLSALERGEVVTQMALSRRLSVSVGLINALLKRVAQKGLVKTKAAPYKRWAYYLTPKGLAEKSRLVAEYLEISLDFFRKARAEYAALFARARACGISRVVLVGRGELVEIALLAAREADMEIAGLLDVDAEMEQCYGLPVLRHVDNMDAEVALVITDSRRPQETFDRLCGRFSDVQILQPPLLRIGPHSSDPPKRPIAGTGN